MRLLLPILTLFAVGTAWADDIPTFYRCGNVLTERPMPACADAVMRERRLEAERAKKAAEAAEKELVAQRELAWWLWKYPNPAAIERQRQESLEQARRSMAKHAARIAALEQQRRALVEACEYCDRSKPMPRPLQSALDSIDADLSMQRAIASDDEHWLKRLDVQYAAIHARMKELWKKAPIESLRVSNP